MEIAGHYNVVLVALSCAVAIFGSFTALNLAARLLVAGPAARWRWMFAASVALGGGIWCMHFVGMLAFMMPMPATYDLELTLLSLVLPILVVGAGLSVISRFGNGVGPLLAAGLLAGLGIVVMHYSGMAAMRMPGVRISYNEWIVAASAAVAFVAALVAFWLAFRTKRTWERSLAAVVMGFAITGMHYTGMHAATFSMLQHDVDLARPAIEPAILAIAVASTFSILLLLGLVTAFFDRKLATLTAKEAVALQQSEERLRALHRNASDIVGILDHHGRFTYEASSAWHILGYKTKELIGQSLGDLVAPEQRSEVETFLALLRKGPDTRVKSEFLLRHSDGAWRDFEVVGKDLSADPAIGGLVLNMRDISERKRLMAELEKASETDQLTGALNRRGFLKRAEVELERGRRDDEPLTILMIDIDRFKAVNDVYGHAAGDLVLAMVAERCRKSIRAIDVLCRWGGEEFIILFAQASLDLAEGIVDRLKQEIAESSVLTIKGEVSVTASFGLASIDSGHADLETVIRMADEALYEAKNAGRNCIRIRA